MTPPFVALKVCFRSDGAARHPMEPTRSLSQLLALVRDALHEVSGFRYASRHLRVPKQRRRRQIEVDTHRNQLTTQVSRRPKPMITHCQHSQSRGPARLPN